MNMPSTMYTGEVVPGGPSDLRELPGLQIRKCSVGDLDNNCYLLTCTGTGEQLLVDAADDPKRLLRLVEEGTGRLSTIVTTHRHHDHVRALNDLASMTGATTMAGRYDADALPLLPGRRLAQGDEIELGRQVLRAVELRGHTPGGIALVWREPAGRTHVFTGDSLFPGGVGKTPTPEDFRSLMDDVEERIFAEYGDDTWVYPGHGKDTTVGAERENLPQWRERGW
ncbi:MBL fold metallo-hydrolase [Austwickia chelonae]|uniref:MBL fold metallo-hydrolase n=1 Tax=Austwickia chelonae TaxID=100225 RepID=UPI000E2329FC|nr:MBL fold metallo-hydrolase [Austwickia chelonae]